MSTILYIDANAQPSVLQPTSEIIMLKPGETFILPADEPTGYDNLTVSQQVDRVIPAILVFLLLCAL